MAAQAMGTRCLLACISPSSRRPACSSSSGSSFGESEYGTRSRRHRHGCTLGPSHLRLSLGRARRSSRAARLRLGRAAPAGGVRVALASGDARHPDALPSRSLERPADARVRTQVHDGAAAPRAVRDPRTARRRPAAAHAGRRLRRLAARPRIPHRHSRRARRRALPAQRGRESRDVPRSPHHRERGRFPDGTGGTPRLHRRHRSEQRAGAVGKRVRRAALGMLPAGRAGDGYPPDAPTGWAPGQGGGRAALSLDALLSSSRNFGPGENCGHALWRPGVGGEGWRSLHYWRWETLVVLIVMRHGATPDEVQKVISVIEEMGYQAQPMPGNQRTAVGLVGNDGRVEASRLEGLPGVHEVIHVSQPYKQVSREWKADPTIVRLPGGVAFGGTEVVVIAGPCSVETERQIIEAARQVKDAGAVVLRGGAWKPRSSPYSFQGLGKPGLRLLAKAREETGLLICTEAMDESGLGWVSEVADIVQLGARNMQNFSLLKVARRCGKPVLLKPGISATVQELLLSAEDLLAEGNHEVILCERGVRGFDPATRNLFDLTAIPVVHKLSHLPIIADPSHGTGLRDKVIPMARAAIAAGADGIMVEVHPNPEEALSDGAQSLFPDQFAQLMREVRIIAEAIGRRVAEPAAVGA